MEKELDSIDFHSLRHTFGTLLAASGVHPKVAQDLMRHSDINLTMSRYTHTLRGQTVSAIESLPDFGLPSIQSNAASATGTDGHGAKSAYKPAYKKLAKKADFTRPPMSSIDIQNSIERQMSKASKSSLNGILDIKKDQMSASGLEYAREDSNLQPSDSKSAHKQARTFPNPRVSSVSAPVSKSTCGHPPLSLGAQYALSLLPVGPLSRYR